MKIDRNQAQIRYTLAHVRLHSVANPSGFTVDELLDAFALISPPSISFDQWCAARGFEPTSYAEENEIALAALKGIIPNGQK